jgi:hypothetical protein
MRAARMNRSLLIGVAGLLLIASSTKAIAFEWKTTCGLSKSRTGTCVVRKGDAALNGAGGYMYTYRRKGGDIVEVFQPYEGSGICRGENQTRKNKGAWFPTNRICEGSWITEQLRSGNTMFVQVYDTP